MAPKINDAFIILGKAAPGVSVRIHAHKSPNGLKASGLIKAKSEPNREKKPLVVKSGYW